MHTSDKLFSDFYQGPSFEFLPTLNDFRKRMMNAVQIAVSFGQPISVQSDDPSDKREFMTIGDGKYKDVFMFTPEGRWVKCFHNVGDMIYKVLPEALVGGVSLLVENNPLLEISKTLGFHQPSAEKLVLPNFNELAVYGMR